MSEEEYCNLCITLIYQTKYLLDKLLVRQQEDFVKYGGIREQMTRARLEYRSRQGNADLNRTNPTNLTDRSDKTDKSD